MLSTEALKLYSCNINKLEYKLKLNLKDNMEA